MNNLVIINGCKADAKKMKEKVEAFKNSLGCDCEEILLYQLNIEASGNGEIADGMEMIYPKLDNSCGFIIVYDKKKYDDKMSAVISRLRTHYKEGELSNKVFGAITEEDDKIKTDLILLAAKDLGMTVSNACFCSCKEGEDLNNVASCIKKLCEFSATLTPAPISNEIKDFNQFTGDETIEEETDVFSEEPTEFDSEDFEGIKSFDEFSVDEIDQVEENSSEIPSEEELGEETTEEENAENKEDEEVEELTEALSFEQWLETLK